MSGIMKLFGITLVLVCYIAKSEQKLDVAKPGSDCTSPYSDLTSCNTSTTLLACMDGDEGPKCNCVEEISALPYLTYSYTIDMEWNITAQKCMSRLGSVCNMVDGAENDVILGHLSNIPCQTGMTCKPSNNYPPEHGICGATGITAKAMSSLVVIGVAVLYWQ